MRRISQSGFGIIVYAVLALAILGTLSGIAYKIRESGKESVRLEVAERDRKAQEEQAAREATARKTAAKAASDLAAAQQKGAEYAAKWRKARAEATKPLASCPESPRSDATRPDGPIPSPSGLRFSWRFVSLHDRAWTGKAGEPVLPDPTPGTVSDPDTPSPIGADQVLDNHAANAEACSVDRRKLDSLIDQIKRLEAGWK